MSQPSDLALRVARELEAKDYLEYVLLRHWPETVNEVAAIIDRHLAPLIVAFAFLQDREHAK